MSWSREPTPELLAHIKQQYEETDKPVKAIAAEAGVRWARIYVWIKKYGWCRRRDRPPLDLPPELRLTLDMDRALEEAEVGAGLKPAPTDSAAPDEGRSEACLAPTDEATVGPSAGLTVAERLERQLEQNLTRVERMREMQWLQGPDDAERATRVLERLTAALLKVRQLQSPNTTTAHQTANTDDDFAIPADIDEFRHALARRIDAFVRSRRDAGVSGPGEPQGADGA